MPTIVLISVVFTIWTLTSVRFNKKEKRWKKESKALSEQFDCEVAFINMLIDLDIITAFKLNNDRIIGKESRSIYLLNEEQFMSWTKSVWKHKIRGEYLLKEHMLYEKIYGRAGL